MAKSDPLRGECVPSHTAAAGWHGSSILFCLALLIFLSTLLATRFHTIDLSSLFLGIAVATLCVVLLFFSRSLLQLHDGQRQTTHALDTTETSLLESEQRFRQMADNIQEIFWMIDAENRRTLYVNPAYERAHSSARLSIYAF